MPRLWLAAGVLALAALALAVGIRVVGPRGSAAGELALLAVGLWLASGALLVLALWRGR